VRTQGFSQNECFQPEPEQGAGTGMIITPDGDVLTNAHVVANATNIKVTLSTDNSTHDAVLLGSDPSADVAVIKVQGVSNLKTVTLGRSSGMRVGDDVVAIGNALALPGGPTVTSGIVSALDRTIDAQDERSAAVRKHQPGDKVEVTWMRGNDRKTATVTLGSRPTGTG